MRTMFNVSEEKLNHGFKRLVDGVKLLLAVHESCILSKQGIFVEFAAGPGLLFGRGLMAARKHEPRCP
jgi:hypothetical protein